MRCLQAIAASRRRLSVIDLLQTFARELSPRFELVRLLEDLGCRIDAVSDGVQALAMLRSKGFDLVFSDVMMPNMGGLKLAAAMLEARFTTPLILTSGYSDDLIGALPAETVIVRKPYDVTSLQVAVVEALGIGKIDF